MQHGAGESKGARQSAARTGTIELRAFMFLSDLFKERRWANPQYFDVDPGTTGFELLAELTIPTERVAAFFVNHRLILPDQAILNPGDRVALVPPGGLIFPELGCRKCRVI